MAKTEKPVPRWQQGFRPHAFEDTWLRMTPRERRTSFVIDMIIVAIVLGIALAMVPFGLMSMSGFWSLFKVVAILLVFLFAANRDPVS